MERKTVKSASRAFKILEYMADQRKPLSLSEIYRGLDYPQSSTTALLKSMVSDGYINFNRKSREYIPTPKVSKLGDWLNAFIYGNSSLLELVDSIAEQTDETVVLATQNDLFVQYIKIVVPDHEFKAPPNIGDMRTMTNSCAGLSIMSTMQPNEIEKLYRYIKYYGLQTNIFADVDELKYALKEIRRLGYCYLPARPTPQVSAISFPLDETFHNIRLSIGVGGFANRIEKNRNNIIKTLQEGIKELHAKQA
jgi:DNA-binding IclR family transcriptional regulator